uniref:Uncharacterized protein n=1 Tax=Anguilla anguilla TaxID=7936 RepID=A0A0E9U7Y1_ANGAN
MGVVLGLTFFPRCCKPAVETVVLFWLCGDGRRGSHPGPLFFFHSTYSGH